MKLADSHTHLTELGYYDLENMYLSSIRLAISPVNFSCNTKVHASTIQDVWDQQLNIQLPRAKNFLIDAYAMIGISMVSIPSDPDSLLSILPLYLKKKEVVAIGEIGYEPGSRSCKDPEVQEYIIKEQIKIAADLRIPVVFHTPHKPDFKVKYTEKLLELCSEFNLPMNLVLIDHCSEDNLGLALKAGATAGISVQPWRGITAEIAANLVLENDENKILINSDCSSLSSDPLAVAKTAYELKKKGAGDDVINKVCYENNKHFYKIDILG